MFGIGVQELLIVLVIALLVFGPKTLPQIGTNMGRAIANFKKGVGGANTIDVTPESKPADTPKTTP